MTDLPATALWNGALQAAVIWSQGPLLYALLYFVGPNCNFFGVNDRMADLKAPLPSDDEIYDFVIVGAGSSGCVLANKLSENFSVLLIESGGFTSPLTSVPAFAYGLYNRPETDWGYQTQPQTQSAFGLNQNVVNWPSGKGAGGSSMLNGMIYTRGNVQGFDDLAEKIQDETWSMKNILKYYKQLENYDGWYNSPESEGKDVHGHQGELFIARPSLAPFVDNLIRAGLELGYPERDPNSDGPNTEGFAKIDMHLNKQGRRSDAFHNHLKPILSRRNLVFRRYSTVTKILFKPNSTVADGVIYEKNGRNYKVRVRNEVILSTGAIGTPKLLLLSGIGPSEHLKDVGINPLLDLPVGQYLQDKYGVPLGPFIVNPGKSVVPARDATLQALTEWVVGGTGPLRTGLSQATYALISPSARLAGRTSAPDIHTYILSLPFDTELHKRLSKDFNFNSDSLNYLEKSTMIDSFFQLITLERPLSKGTVRLRDSNPSSPLLIDPQYFSDELDFTAVVEGVQFATKLVEGTKAFKEIGGHLIPDKVPGCEKEEFKSKEYFQCVVRRMTATAYKYSGTAPIGSVGDEDAVVDDRLMVIGATNLRIVDGSVLQHKYMSVNDVTCRAVALLAADLVKQDWAL